MTVLIKHQLQRQRRETIKAERKIDHSQVIINNDLLVLERGLGNSLEGLSKNVLCEEEIVVGFTGALKSSVQRYTTFIRDILQLADLKSLRQT